MLTTPFLSKILRSKQKFMHAPIPSAFHKSLSSPMTRKSAHNEEQISVARTSVLKPHRQLTRECFTTKARIRRNRFAGWSAQARRWGSISITLYAGTAARCELLEPLLTVMTRARRQYSIITTARRDMTL